MFQNTLLDQDLDHVLTQEPPLPGPHNPLVLMVWEQAASAATAAPAARPTPSCRNMPPLYDIAVALLLLALLTATVACFVQMN